MTHHVSDRVIRYLDRYGCDRRWKIEGKAPKGLDIVVVIPALAESGHLFGTLKSIASNDRNFLSCTTVVCVINNGTPGRADLHDIRDNQRTLDILRRVSGRRVRSDDGDDAAAVAESGLNISYIDASSEGLEMPPRGGVGMARKIGMDRSLEIFDWQRDSRRLLFSLDADTLVNPDWLSVTARCMEERRLMAAVIEFAHQAGETGEADDAITHYETFIRYYRLGLEYAQSPYAYHAVGSTIAVSADGYLAVRGIPRREAGEDFHFLNKLAKTGKVGLVSETRVYPSARISKRVPFGTGQALLRSRAHGNALESAWDPRVFSLLRDWNAVLGRSMTLDATTVLKAARAIHPALSAFLSREGFETLWPRLLKNSGSEGVTPRVSFGWFDALKTYKLIRYLTGHVWPPVPLYRALEELLLRLGRNGSLGLDISGNLPDPVARRFILEELRSCSGADIPSR